MSSFTKLWGSSAIVSCILAMGSCTTDQGRCDSNDDCGAGYVCLDRTCTQACVTTQNCIADGTCCIDGFCLPCPTRPPVIHGIDATGSDDPDPTHAAHHVSNRLIITGENLAGATAFLQGIDVETMPQALEPCGEQTDTRMEVALPETLASVTASRTEASLLLTVENQAGECSNQLRILQGEDGSFQGGGVELVAEINASLAADANLGFARYVDKGGDAMTGELSVAGGLGVGTSELTADLAVQGRLHRALTGTVGATGGNATLTGSGTDFLAELVVGDALRTGDNTYVVTAIASATSLTLDPVPAKGFSDLTAFGDGDLLRVANGAGEAKLVVDESGNVTLGNTAPQAMLSFGDTHSSDARCTEQPFGYDSTSTIGGCRNDVVAIYEEGEHKYGLGIHSATLEVFAPPAMSIQLGTRRDDGSGIFEPHVTVASDGSTRFGPTNSPGSSPAEGARIYFSGGPALAGWNGDNSDPLWIGRYNVASDETELRIVIGDNMHGDDKLVVGIMNPTLNPPWQPKFTLYNNGNYTFAGSAVSTRASKRDIEPFDESALALLEEIELVTFHYKTDPPSRAKRIGIIADDPEHRYDERLTNRATGFDVESVAATLIKAVQEQQALLAQQRAEIDALRAIVCADHPRAAYCR